MHVFLTGSSGLIGSKLAERLAQSEHQVTRLVRRPPKKNDEREWDPHADRLEQSVLDGAAALIHLAGASIAGRRWNADYKKEIRNSRVNSTRLLAECIATMDRPPQVMVVASAIGYYGDRGDETLTEASSPGSNFLAEVCQEWESAAAPAETHCRVVHVRSGMVLSGQGGALKSMLLPFRLGVGGVVGSGKQIWSWISRDDSTRLFQFAVENDAVRGAVNGVSPEPVTNREFTGTLGKVLHRPTIFPMPATAARLALGEMADELILASARVIPERTKSFGFEFQDTDLEATLHGLDI